MSWVASNTLVREFEFIVECDPALQKGGEFENSYRLYLERGDATLLPILPGQAPVIWTLRHLNPRVVARCAQLRNESKDVEMLLMAAQYALQSVKGVPTKDGGDFTIELARCPEFRCPMATDDTMSKIMEFSYEAIIQLGVRALNRSPLS